jgi:glucosamine--fructose-6-phosphate aminotransferase (isomerizing)
MIGNGTSYHSSLFAVALARRLAAPEAPVSIAMTAGEFRTARPALGPGDVVVGVSASGEFRDVVGVFEELRGSVPTVAVVHAPGSSLTRIADHVVLTAGGDSTVPVMTKTFSTTATGAALTLAGLLGQAEYDDVARGALRAADAAEHAIAAAGQRTSRIVELLKGCDQLFVVGGGLAHPAALEAALKIKEMALVAAEASETWEMASGPATLVGPGTVVIAIAPDGPAHDATIDVAEHCTAWGAHVVWVDSAAVDRGVPGQGRAATDGAATDGAVPDGDAADVRGDVRLPLLPGTEERFAVLSVVPPLALVAYALARARGIDPDRPAWTERYARQGLRHIVGISG